MKYAMLPNKMKKSAQFRIIFLHSLELKRYALSEIVICIKYMIHIFCVCIFG